MKKLAVGGLSLLFAAGLVGISSAAEKSVTGTLADSFCYVTMGAHGSDHMKCAEACAKKGIPVALLDKDGKIHILLPPKDKEALPHSVISKMENEVTVTGDEYTKGGIDYITVKSVK